MHPQWLYVYHHGNVKLYAAWLKQVTGAQSSKSAQQSLVAQTFLDLYKMVYSSQKWICCTSFAYVYNSLKIVLNKVCQYNTHVQL